MRQATDRKQPVNNQRLGAAGAMTVGAVGIRLRVTYSLLL